MPRPRVTESYPAQIRDWVDFLASDSTPLATYEVELGDEKEAEATRFTFYNYLKACDRSTLPDKIRAAAGFRSYMMQVKENKLVFQPRSTTELSLTLGDALFKAQAKAQAKREETGFTGYYRADSIPAPTVHPELPILRTPSSAATPIPGDEGDALLKSLGYTPSTERMRETLKPTLVPAQPKPPTGTSEEQK